MKVSAGRPLANVLRLAYEADLPVLLRGFHGVGKSAVVAHAAEEMQLEVRDRDLSLMEPPDLIGLPRIENGQTHFAAPAFLPQDGSGFLLLEELNRAPRYMQVPCLQLMTARTLNDYRLPDGWLPVAAINDGENYQVEDLDDALLSRFLTVQVVADADEWVAWAKTQNVHSSVVEFVDASPGIFEDPRANPRAWTMVNALLGAWEASSREQEPLIAGLRGLVGAKWALAFHRFCDGSARPMKPDEIIGSYPAHQSVVRTWKRKSQLDAIAATLELFRRHIQRHDNYRSIVANTTHKANVERFFADLPAELKRELRSWLEERGFDDLNVPARGKP